MKQVDSIDGVISTNPSIFGDNRGKFAELQTTRIDFGYNFHPLQTAISISKKGVLRGMHYQLPPFALRISNSIGKYGRSI